MTTMVEAPHEAPHPCSVPWCGVNHIANPDEPHSGDADQFKATLDVGLMGQWFLPEWFSVGVEQLRTSGEVVVNLIGINGGAMLLSLEEARRMAAWMTRLCEDVDRGGI